MPTPSFANCSWHSPRGFDKATSDDVALFEAERPRLTGLAYRMLSSVVDAEDIVQEAWLRWTRQDQPAITNAAAWLATVTTRLCFDRLREIDRRRESYVGPWLAEPVATERGPEQTAELADTLTLGFLLVLDRLSPIERAVFVLADVFGEPYRRIAEIVGKSEEACRQIASRSRRRVREDRGQVTSGDQQLLAALLATLSTADEDAMVRLLHPDAVLVSDGGANQRAARRPIVGPERIARFLLGIRDREPITAVELAIVNGADSIIVMTPERRAVFQFEFEDGLVRGITIATNPDKLHALDRTISII